MQNYLPVFSYGICGDLLRWLTEFFTGRTHQTRVGFSISDVAKLLSGVVQGSGIGPVMFLIYIDDFAKLLESHDITAKLFADDVKIYFRICRSEDGVLLQQALDLIAVWASEWQLSISVSKCNLLNIGHSRCEQKYPATKI